ncbi:MAG TPA: STAS-like domain-containing protein [Candidatus Saccharimonadales bacterium]|nr:STAS-like domain-containing protein [Candidatus Saccharimonadales bacterium]
MKAKDIILKVAQERHVFKTADVARLAPSFSRQYLSILINSMVKQGDLVREGSGRWSTYALPQFKDYLGHRISKRLPLPGLKEHEVLDDIMRASQSLHRVSENVRSIFNYAFSEMLNNAIDHSRSADVEVEVVEEGHNIKFIINDFGVGVFRDVMRQRRLASELEAIQDLLKGKVTTAPQAHSGEGIFFTSKAADIFILDSFGLRLRIDNLIGDVFIEELPRSKTGTRVTFFISTSSKRHLNEIFRKYQVDPEVPAFDKTEIKIKLYTLGTIYISRSQARRIVTDLDKFRLVILDFNKVPTIGQAFADEIFRVFKRAHPDIEIRAVNTNEAVQFMIDRVDS